MTHSSSTGSAAWVSANVPLAIPFSIRLPVVVEQIGWFNGSSAGGGVDLGIYDLSWNRLVSAGTTTGSGSSAFQWINVTDTLLAVGRYYLVNVRDNVTANRQTVYTHTASAPLMQFMGCFDSATAAYPLPDPLTNMVAATTITRLPLVFMVMRAPFV